MIQTSTFIIHCTKHILFFSYYSTSRSPLSLSLLPSHNSNAHAPDDRDDGLELWYLEYPFPSFPVTIRMPFNGASLGPRESDAKRIQSVCPFLYGSRSWPTHRDRPRYSVCSNSPHMAPRAARRRTHWRGQISHVVHVIKYNWYCSADWSLIIRDRREKNARLLITASDQSLISCRSAVPSSCYAVAANPQISSWKTSEQAQQSETHTIVVPLLLY